MTLFLPQYQKPLSQTDEEAEPLPEEHHCQFIENYTKNIKTSKQVALNCML
jgi:hypothetical protein